MDFSVNMQAGGLSVFKPTIEFARLWFVGLGWVILVAVVSAVTRVRRGKPLFRPSFPDARFSERWRSGASRRSLLTRFGGANHCLWIVVTDDQLRVGPHFPFNLLFLPEIYGLEYRLTADDFVAVDDQLTTFGSTRVIVRFRRPDGAEEAFELHLKDPSAFRRAVESMKRDAHGKNNA